MIIKFNVAYNVAEELLFTKSDIILSPKNGLTVARCSVGYVHELFRSVEPFGLI